MKKSGKTKSSKKSKPQPKKSRTKKQESSHDLELSEEEPIFSSENEYMNYIASKNSMTKEIQENFDEPYTYLMGNADNIITKSTYTKIEYENGKPVNEEVYQSESVNHKDKKGHKIAEKKEKYKNEKAGIEKISHQKLMDGKGTKVIRQVNLNSGDKEEHNIYQGIKEKNVKDFNKKYNDFKEKVKLDEMFQQVKLLGRKRNLDKGKVLLLGDGNENKENNEIKEDKEEKKEKRETKDKKEKKEIKNKKEKTEKKEKKENYKKDNKIKEVKKETKKTEKKKESRKKSESKSRSKNKSKNKNRKIKK